MKRIVLMLGALLAVAFSLTACGLQEPQKVISRELGIDISGGNERLSLDTHGGFHGDGTTYTVLEFSDESVLEQIRESGRWKSFPLDNTVKALIYGTENETCQIGPYVSDDNGNALIPYIQDGYYLLNDRQAASKKASEKELLHRASFNFTLGIYSTNTNTLYFCRFDT